jgi:hypothetical protein
MKKTSLPSNEILLYVLSAATAVTVAWALIYIDGGQADALGRALVFLRGSLVGGVGGLATAIVANRAQRVTAKAPKQWALYSLGGMLVVELVIVSFVTYSTLNPAMLFLWWPLRALISLSAGAFIPAIAIGLASTSGALQAETQVPAQGEQPDAKPSKKISQASTPAFTDENLIAQYGKNGKATDEALAKIFRKSHQAVGNRKRNLMKTGTLYRDENGFMRVSLTWPSGVESKT